MNQKVFGDVDLTVHVMRNPMLPQADGTNAVYNGLVFQVNCQDCETPTQMGLEWGEVRILLDGGALPGVTRVNDGWIIAVQCQNSSEGCSQVTQISVNDEELEKHAALEVARRQRMAKAAGGFPGGQPQARRPLVRR